MLDTHQIAETKDLAPLRVPLKAIFTRSSGIFTRPSTRRRVIDALEHMVAALDKLPIHIPETWTQDQIKPIVAEAVAAQKAVVQDLTKRIQTEASF